MERIAEEVGTGEVTEGMIDELLKICADCGAAHKKEKSGESHGEQQGIYACAVEAAAQKVADLFVREGEGIRFRLMAVLQQAQQQHRLWHGFQERVMNKATMVLVDRVREYEIAALEGKFALRASATPVDDVMEDTAQEVSGTVIAFGVMFKELYEGAESQEDRDVLTDMMLRNGTWPDSAKVSWMKVAGVSPGNTVRAMEACGWPEERIVEALVDAKWLPLEIINELYKAGWEQVDVELHYVEAIGYRDQE